MDHPPTYVGTFSLHKVRENCHFLDHPPTPLPLRNIKMAPKPELCAWRMKLKNVEEPTPEIINEVLLLMRAQFAEHGKDMVVDYNLPEPMGRLMKQKREVSRELDYNMDEMAKLAKDNESKMNTEQLDFYKAVDTESGGVYALQASGMYK